jgi:hypothetical protein
VWEDSAIPFYASQRRYVRIETDAGSEYHDPNDIERSKINVILGPDLYLAGSSPLRHGRMRLVIECANAALKGASAGISVELFRKGLPTLSDERTYIVVDAPPPKNREQQSTMPQFKLVPIDGPSDQGWSNIAEESNDIEKHALRYEYNQGVLYVYYSLSFPRFYRELSKLEKQDSALAGSFKTRYGTWLAVHSILHYQQRESDPPDRADEDLLEEFDRAERCRFATVAAMVAAQEVRSGATFDDE